jgi:DNA-binding IclR family transcriptional regulator
MINMNNDQQNQVLVIGKAARLLEAFRSDDSLGLSELSERLGMSKSTAHRLLSSLEQVGFVTRESKPGTYRLGLKLFELGSLVQERLELRRIALPFMSRLVDQTDETAFLVIRDGLQGACIERIDGRHVQSLVLKMGGSLPLHAGAGTRCLLAYSPPEVLEQLLAAGPLEVFTPYTVIDPDAVRADVVHTRRQGYALSYQDVTIGVVAVGAPLFDHRNVVVGALSVCGITPRWTDEHMAQVSALLFAAARQISLKMGWQPPAGASAESMSAQEDNRQLIAERRRFSLFAHHDIRR